MTVPIAADHLYARTVRVLARNVRLRRAAARLTLMRAGGLSGLHWRHWQKVEVGSIAVCLCVEPFDLFVPPPTPTPTPLLFVAAPGRGAVRCGKPATCGRRS